MKETTNINIFDLFNEIMDYSHYWNWAPDWQVLKDIYRKFPDSYAVLSPFAYSYLEELIRSTTSEYGRELLDKNNKPKRRSVGFNLIQLSIEENKQKRPEFISILEGIKKYYLLSQPTDQGGNRNSVAHGYMHSKFWDKESFENLIHDIARLSKYAGF